MCCFSPVSAPVSWLARLRDFGFAAFQLEPGRQQIHPMGFRFRTRDPSRLLFPTVHVHDGRVVLRREIRGRRANEDTYVAAE
jgi:hypothetical protein